MTRLSAQQIQNLPARERPQALAPWINALQRLQDKFPIWIELDPCGKSFETVKSQVNTAVAAWLKHGYDLPLDRNWFLANWGGVVVRSEEYRVWLAPKGEELFDPNRAESCAANSGGDCLVYFEQVPGREVLEALAVLLDREVLPGQVRCAKPFPTELMEKFDNIEVFKPEGEPYWVMM